MPNIKNTNQVIVNNNIKAQDELKILSKLSKMGLLKTQAKQRKRAPRQARMSPQMIPQAPEVGRTAPIAFDRTQQAGIDRATLEEAIRRSSVPSNTNDLENDVRFTNQGSQDIPKDSKASQTDLAPEADTTFSSEPAPYNVDIGIQSQPALVRNQEQEVPDQRPQAQGKIDINLPINENVKVDLPVKSLQDRQQKSNKLRTKLIEIFKKELRDRMSEDDFYGYLDAVEVDPDGNEVEALKLRIPTEKGKKYLDEYRKNIKAIKSLEQKLGGNLFVESQQPYFSSLDTQGDI
jgi:hypothetical protein